jgi:tetratricopeptide (TPR) repeat protein
MPIRRSLVALSLCVIFNAQAADDTLGSAQKLLQEGRGTEAYALLQKSEEARAGEPAFDLLLGAAALQSGQPTRAVFALERVLAQQPNNSDARELIGQAYLALGELEASKKALADARRQSPAAAAERIDRMLGQIAQLEKDQGTRITAYVEASLGTDSNVNSATGSQTVAIPSFGGALATLAPGAVRQRDEYIGFAAGVGLRHRLDPQWSILANANASLKLNNSRNQFDNDLLNGSVGVNFERNSNQFLLAWQGNTLSVDSNRIRDYSGLMGQWRRAMSQAAETSLYVQHGRLSYPGQTFRDTDRTVLGAAWVQSLAMRLNPTMFLSGYAGEENELSANVQHLGHRLLGARAGAEASLSAKTTAYASLGYEQRRYGGQEPFFLRARSDRQWDLQVGMRYALAPKWTVTPSLSYLDNHSNVQIYKFDRTLINVAVRHEFN